MRMTRAALRAQSSAEEFPEVDHESTKQEIVQIHQDPESLGDVSETDSQPVRSALRDITEENYPTDPFVDHQVETDLKEVENKSKKARKVRGKKASSKVDVEEVVALARNSSETLKDSEVIRELEETAQIEEPVQIHHLEASQQAELVDTNTLHPADAEPVIRVTEEASTTEDFSIDSVRTKSPAKSAALQSDSSNTVSSTDNLGAQPPSQRRASSSFEASFEAMDSLEDNIEQLTADLPTLSAQAINVPESPQKRTTLVSPARRLSPAKSPARLDSRSEWNKENKAPVPQKTPSKSPLRKQPLPFQAKTPSTSTKTPISARTPAARVRSPLKTAATPAIAIDHKNTTSPRKSVVVKRPALSQTANGNKMSSPMKPVHNRAKSQGISSSESPAKMQQMHKRRITSAVLSTAKPGFIPSKSTKAPTTSTFMLPSEAIAEKLKAQKEAREERMRTQGTKMTVAEEKAARLKAEREAREERVRMNQTRETRETSGSFTLSSEAVAEKLKAQKEAREERLKTQPPKMTVAEEKAVRLKAEREAREERVRQNQLKETRDTSASFTLSSEAVAEKLKAQKEAREERMKQQDGKAALAAEKAAKLKADREAREERVKLNQKRAEEQAARARDGKQELNVNKVRLDIQKARAEAAERGRQASREWAAKKKMQGQSVTTGA